MRVVQDAPGVGRDSSWFRFVDAGCCRRHAFSLITTGTDGQCAGPAACVSPNVLRTRTFAKAGEGRMFQPGLSSRSWSVGMLRRTYIGLTLGNTVQFGGSRCWQVVGIFDAGGSAVDLWRSGCDAKLLNEILKRPDNVFQSVTVPPRLSADFSAIQRRCQLRSAHERGRHEGDRLLR